MTRAGTLDVPSVRRWRFPTGLILAPIAVAIAAGASPSVAQGLPRFFFPAVAVIGAVAAAVGLTRALLRFARGERRRGSGDIMRLGGGVTFRF